MASGKYNSIPAVDGTPFLNQTYNVSPTLKFRVEDNKISDLDFDNDVKETVNASNNLQFYPSRDAPGLTRSLGALNLSLGNGKFCSEASSAIGNSLTPICNVNEASRPGRKDEGKTSNASRWASFTPRIHRNIKRTAGRLEMRRPLTSAPTLLINRESVLQGPLTESSPKDQKKKSNKPLIEAVSFIDAKPDPSAFKSNGLMPKLRSNLFPQKLKIPDTPVKRTPHILLVKSPLDNSKICGHAFKVSQIAETDSLLVNSSHKPALRTQGAGVNKEIHKQQKRKRSKIIKNTELSNTLQEFTNDLFGFNDERLLFETSPVETPMKRNRHEDKNILLQAPDDGADLTLFNKSVRKNRSINVAVYNPDEHLTQKFTNIITIGKGQFSTVYQVTFPETQMKYAIKSMSPNKRNMKGRILQEIRLLSEIHDETRDAEGKEYIIQFISSWEYHGSFYIMTELCENGNLDHFLQEQVVARAKKLEDWRIWKIIVEICLALRFIHDFCSIVHLDVKPANILITFEGNLKLADLGMATKLPLSGENLENEGDREYIAPEIISDGIYDFRADIFSLGLMIVEIAANVILPDNGNAWHKLRSGDLSDAGRFSSSEIHSDSIFSSTNMQSNLTDTTQPESYNADLCGKETLPAWVPKFLMDNDSLERMVIWMVEPDYRKRPTANNILQTEECQYVELTRKAGAIIQEDDFDFKSGFFI